MNPSLPAKNWLDRENFELARQLADKRHAWKTCSHRACKRARRCAIVEPSCQGVREVHRERIDNLLAGFAFNRRLLARLAALNPATSSTSAATRQTPH